ncbi:MAG: TIGR00730 family Rossman fold protein [Desulfovibrio sp.]|uniref:LOG family protein n=1 Tax=Desulfovibrio sp. 7SRBS1 TaxID=3378064 RepID=UPI003B3F8255
MRNVCVFLGSAHGNDPIYEQTAKDLARAIAGRGLELVYGGSNSGLMGVLATTAMEAGGEVTGVIPQGLVDKEIAHPNLTRSHVVADMLARKKTMIELSEAFVILPGGLGTLDELFEVVTWCQLGLSKAPCGLLNVNGYYDHLNGFLDRIAESGFVAQRHRDMILCHEEPEALLDMLERAEVPTPKFG